MGQESERFEIARVISRTFEVIGRDPGLYLGLAALLAALPNFVVSYWQLNAAIGFDSWLAGSLSALQVAGGMLLTGLVATGLMQASITRATVAMLSGERTGFAACLLVALRLAVPVCGIWLLTWIALLLAVLTITVPAYLILVNATLLAAMAPIIWTLRLATFMSFTFAFVLFSLAIPAYVAERPGLFESFGRSIELVHGVRWKMFLLVLIGALPTAALGAGAFVLGGLLSSSGLVLPLLVFAASGAILWMFWSTLLASAYVELRAIKDGVAPSDLETIFA